MVFARSLLHSWLALVVAACAQLSRYYKPTRTSVLIVLFHFGSFAVSCMSGIKRLPSIVIF